MLLDVSFIALQSCQWFFMWLNSNKCPIDGNWRYNSHILLTYQRYYLLNCDFCSKYWPFTSSKYINWSIYHLKLTSTLKITKSLPVMIVNNDCEVSFAIVLLCVLIIKNQPFTAHLYSSQQYVHIRQVKGMSFIPYMASSWSMWMILNIIVNYKALVTFIAYLSHLPVSLRPYFNHSSPIGI